MIIICVYGVTALHLVRHPIVSLDDVCLAGHIDLPFFNFRR